MQEKLSPKVTVYLPAPAFRRPGSLEVNFPSLGASVQSRTTRCDGDQTHISSWVQTSPSPGQIWRAALRRAPSRVSSAPETPRSKALGVDHSWFQSKFNWFITAVLPLDPSPRFEKVSCRFDLDEQGFWVRKPCLSHSSSPVHTPTLELPLLLVSSFPVLSTLCLSVLST